MAPSRTPRRAATRQQTKPPVSKVTGRVTKATTRKRSVDTRAKIPDLPKTPGWTSGTAALFDEMQIRTHSPLRGKRITRRSSVMIQTIGGFGDVFKKPTTLGVRPPAANRQKTSLSTSPAMTRAKRRESVYLHKQTLQAEFHSVMSSIDTKITMSKIPRKKSLSPKKVKDSGSMGKRASSPKKRSPSPRKRSPSPKKRSPSTRKRSPSPKKKSPSTRKRSPSPKKSPARKSRKSPPKKTSPKKYGQTRKRSVSPQIKNKSVSPGRSKKVPSPKVAGDANTESQKVSSVIVAVREESTSVTRKSSRLQTPRRNRSPAKRVASSKRSARSTKKSPGKQTVSPKPVGASKVTPASSARSSARSKRSAKTTPSPVKSERKAKSKSPPRKRTPTTTPKPTVKELTRKRLHSPESRKESEIRTSSTTKTSTKKATPARSHKRSTPKPEKTSPSRDNEARLASGRFGRNQPLVQSPLVSGPSPDVTSPIPSLRRVKVNLRKVVLTSPVHRDTPRPSSKIRKRPLTPGRATPAKRPFPATPPKAARILGKTPRDKAPRTSTPVRASKKRQAEMPPPVSEIHQSKMSRLTVTGVMDVTEDIEMVEKELNGKEECKAVVAKSWWSGWCTIL